MQSVTCYKLDSNHMRMADLAPEFNILFKIISRTNIDSKNAVFLKKDMQIIIISYWKQFSYLWLLIDVKSVVLLIVKMWIICLQKNRRHHFFFLLLILGNFVLFSILFVCSKKNKALIANTRK